MTARVGSGALVRPCCTAGVLVLLLACGADAAPARTPAEIERRRAEVSERLAAIDLESAALEALRRGLPAHADGHEAGGAAERQRLEARLGALADEKAALERELRDLALVRTRNATGPLQPGDPAGLSPLDLGGQTGQVSSGQAFNPAISVIPDVAYYYDDRDGRGFDLLEGADGFAGPGHQGDDVHGHGHGALDRGFNLREMELALSGAVDPYFDVWATLALGTDGIAAEEVYVQTRSLLPGLQLRLGRFFSGVGHVNKQHPHQWDFVDQALVHRAIFGGNLGDVGLQLTWLPSLPFYTLFGVEALQGDNGLLANQEHEAHAEFFADIPGPRLFTGFVKVAPELGYSHTLQAGLSFGRSRSHQEATEFDDGDVDQALAGTAWFAATDWVWRYDSARPFGQSDVTVQAEYVYRKKDLALVAGDGVAGVPGAAQVSSQDGLYAQSVYGIAPRWTVAGRLDVVGLTNRVAGPGAVLDYGASTRYSAAVTLNPTEFSRLRLQYTTGRVWRGERVGVNQLYVQFQMSLGAHGAHRF